MLLLPTEELPRLEAAMFSPDASARLRDWLVQTAVEMPFGSTPTPRGHDARQAPANIMTGSSAPPDMDRQGRRSSPRRQQRQVSSPKDDVEQTTSSPSDSVPSSSVLPTSRQTTLSYRTTDATSTAGSASPSRQRVPKRSSSPAKRKVDLFMAQPQIRFTAVGANSPADVRQLNKKLSTIHDGIGIMPLSIRVSVRLSIVP